MTEGQEICACVNHCCDFPIIAFSGDTTKLMCIEQNYKSIFLNLL